MYTSIVPIHWTPILIFSNTFENMAQGITQKLSDSISLYSWILLCKLEIIEIQIYFFADQIIIFNYYSISKKNYFHIWMQLFVKVEIMVSKFFMYYVRLHEISLINLHIRFFACCTIDFICSYNYFCWLFRTWNIKSYRYSFQSIVRK